MTLTVIENLFSAIGWTFFWISLAFYGSSVASKGLLEGRAIVILSITAWLLMLTYAIYGKNEFASLIHAIIFCVILAGMATTILSLRKKTKAPQAGTGQPATRPLSDSEGSYNPHPEAEGRSR